MSECVVCGAMPSRMYLRFVTVQVCEKHKDYGEPIARTPAPAPLAWTTEQEMPGEGDPCPGCRTGKLFWPPAGALGRRCNRCGYADAGPIPDPAEPGERKGCAPGMRIDEISQADWDKLCAAKSPEYLRRLKASAEPGEPGEGK